MVQAVQTAYTWWIKYYANVVITDEGVFAEDMVPDDYGGPQLSMEVVTKIIAATPKGYFSEIDYTDLNSVMDSDRKKGMGYTVQEFPDIPLLFSGDSPPSGPSQESLMVYYRENPYFSDVKKKLVALMSAVLENPSL